MKRPCRRGVDRDRAFFGKDWGGRAAYEEKRREGYLTIQRKREGQGEEEQGPEVEIVMKREKKEMTMTWGELAREIDEEAIMNGKAWANRHYRVWVAPTTRKHLTPGRVLFRTPTELVANRMWMEGDITWTIIVGKEQRRPFQSRTGGRQEELEGLRKSLMEGEGWQNN